MDPPRIVEQIKIQCARRIGNGTLAAESRFDLMQKCQQRKGLKHGAQGGHGIHEGWVGGIGPGLALVKGRNRRDFEARIGESPKRGFQGIGGRSRDRRNIGTQSNQDWANQDRALQGLN